MTSIAFLLTRRQAVLSSVAVAAVTLGWGLVLGLAGCEGAALSPSFVNVIDPEGTSSLTTLDNAPGHVIVTMVNNAEVDERLLAYLESPEGGSLVLTDAEKRALRPRIRMRVLITYTDGTENTIEFINGSSNLVESSFDATSEPDLNENSLDNVVGICDVASVQVVDNVEVFIPVEIAQFQFTEPTETMPGFYREIGRIDPAFRALLVDEVDEDLNTTARFNIDIRDQPATANNPNCGSVVAIEVNGTLSVPFFEVQGGVPGYDVEDIEAFNSIGGRYEFRVTLQ